jgi:hypothetical protein
MLVRGRFLEAVAFWKMLRLAKTLQKCTIEASAEGYQS